MESSVSGLGDLGGLSTHEAGPKHKGKHFRMIYKQCSVDMKMKSISTRTLKSKQKNAKLEKQFIRNIRYNTTRV